MKIKICHLVNIIDGRADGVFQHLRLLLKYMDKNKYEQVVIFHGNPQIELELKKMGILYYVLPDLNDMLPVKSFWPIYRIVKKSQFDIIHVHTIKPYVIAGIVNIFLKRKMIYNYHGSFIKSIYRNRLISSVYRLFHNIISHYKSVQMVIAPSKASLTELLGEAGQFPNAMYYYNGASKRKDSETRNTPIEIPDGKIIIGIVARLNIEKKIDIALRIIKKVSDKQSNAYFMIFGEGPLENELKKQTEELNLNEVVRFCGYIQEISEYYKKINILLNTSDSEGFPLSIWEALSFGIPVIASDVGGIREIIKAENCGRVFPKGDIEACAGELMEIINNRKLYEIMSQNCLKITAEKYTVDNFIGQMEQIYSTLLMV